jgi:hypothetical protein
VEPASAFMPDAVASLDAQARRIFGETRCDHRPGGAAANHDEIELLSHVPPCCSTSF